jgi:hypothetical protein
MPPILASAISPALVLPEEDSGKRPQGGLREGTGDRARGLVGSAEAEIMLGTLDDAPTGIVPEYELWAGRREEWMLPLPWTEQFDQDRPEGVPADNQLSDKPG